MFNKEAMKGRVEELTFELHFEDMSLYIQKEVGLGESAGQSHRNREAHSLKDIVDTLAELYHKGKMWWDQISSIDCESCYLGHMKSVKGLGRRTN